MNDAALCWCDVIAVGRCQECGRAFCGSHQAVLNATAGWHNLPMLVAQPLCTDCLADQHAEAERLRQEQAAAEQATRDARVDAAHHFVAAMLQAGSPGMATWRTSGPNAPAGPVQGWLLDGHERIGGSDAYGDHGQLYRDLVLTSGHLGTAWDRAESMRDRVRANLGTLTDVERQTDARLRRWFDSYARAYRRASRRPLEVSSVRPFSDLADDRWQASTTFEARMAAVAAEHGVRL
ncbi:hypothetical protein ACIPPM_10300 [Streptomyces sp. NPDC090119]|uniref:hypothetical protein n=1 Tax=Streptomyces sp. NPDC090119 TaxID=3365951 RepID=UPI0037FC3B50